VSVVAAASAEHHSGNAPTGAQAARLVTAQSNRYEYWKVAVRAFADHPLAGTGSAGFRVQWLRERPFAESVHDAHSLYLETAAELGVCGLLALLACCGGLVVGAVRAVRRERAAAAGAAAALAVWLLHAGLDWDWEMPALSLVALVLGARLLAGGPGDRAAAA
jgi:O-antigen ligase